MGGSWGDLGVMLEGSWGVLGRSWGDLGGLWGDLGGDLGRILGESWGVLEGSLTVFFGRLSVGGLHFFSSAVRAGLHTLLVIHHRPDHY